MKITLTEKAKVIIVLILLVAVSAYLGSAFMSIATKPCNPIIPDSQVIAYHLVGSITLEGDSLARADFNGDGVVNGLDLVLTLRGEQ